MNAIITTTLSFFNMHNIKPNFSALAREYESDRLLGLSYYSSWPSTSISLHFMINYL